MVHHVLIMSVNPGFGGQEFIPFSLDKIRHLAELRRELGLAFKIEVDGGVAHDTVAQVVQAGAELLVAGNAVFGAGQRGAGCARAAGAGPQGGGRIEDFPRHDGQDTSAAGKLAARYEVV